MRNLHYSILFLISAALISGCISKQEIRASVWLNNGMDPEICKTVPAVRNYGFYRRLDSGKLEFKPYCDADSVHWLSIFDQDLDRILDGTIPNPPSSSELMSYVRGDLKDGT